MATAGKQWKKTLKKKGEILQFVEVYNVNEVRAWLSLQEDYTKVL